MFVAVPMLRRVYRWSIPVFIVFAVLVQMWILYLVGWTLGVFDAPQAMSAEHLEAVRLVETGDVLGMDRGALNLRFGEPRDVPIGEGDEAFLVQHPADDWGVDSLWLVVTYDGDGRVLRAAIVSD